MQPPWKLAGVMIVGLLVGGGLLIANPGQTQPSRSYLENDIKYFPPGPEVRLAATSKEHHAALGDLLFADVVSVHFIGPGHPANPDGSLGGLVAGDNGIQMKIYERFIVLDSRDADGTTLRTLHAYESLGRIEQRLPQPKVNAKAGKH